MPRVAAGEGRRKRRRRPGGGGWGGGGGSRTSERAGMAECGACARPRREARRDCLPLCEACGERFDRRAPDEFFLAAYAAPAFVLRARGAVLEPLLEPLMLPAPRGPPSQASADEVLRPLLALDGASPPPPLLVLLGSGASAAYGVRPNYGPGDAEGDASLGVNERYWRVLKDSAAAATSGTPDACFYSRLGAFLRARKGASACVATTNIDGLAGRWLDAGGAPCTALELHGSVLRLQCATRGAPCCDSVRPTPLEDVAASTSASECEWSCETCGGRMRLNVSSFDDEPGDVLDVEDVQERLQAFAGDHLLRGGEGPSTPTLHVLVVGCGEHVHSLVHEARAVACERALAGLGTRVACVNPCDAGARAFGEGCLQVGATAEELGLAMVRAVEGESSV